MAPFPYVVTKLPRPARWQHLLLLLLLLLLVCSLARTHVLTLLALIRSASHSNSPTSKPPRCLRFERLARWS